MVQILIYMQKTKTNKKTHKNKNRKKCNAYSMPKRTYRSSCKKRKKSFVYSMQNGQESGVQLLLDGGADINLSTYLDNIPLKQTWIYLYMTGTVHCKWFAKNDCVVAKQWFI